MSGEQTQQTLVRNIVPEYLGLWGFPGDSVVKNPPVNAGDIRDVGLISRLGRSLEAGHGNPLQYSCLENPMHRGAWRATVHEVTKESNTT